LPGLVNDNAAQVVSIGKELHHDCGIAGDNRMLHSTSLRIHGYRSLRDIDKSHDSLAICRGVALSEVRALDDDAHGLKSGASLFVKDANGKNASLLLW
jgi:hypothetical protein